MSTSNIFRNFNWGFNVANQGHQILVDDDFRSFISNNANLEIKSNMDAPPQNNITKLLADPNRLASKGFLRVSVKLAPYATKQEPTSKIIEYKDVRYFLGIYQPTLQTEGDRPGNYGGSFIFTKPNIKLNNEVANDLILRQLYEFNNFLREKLVKEDNGKDRFTGNLSQLAGLPSEEFATKLEQLDSLFDRIKQTEIGVMADLSQSKLLNSWPAGKPLIVDASQDNNAIARALAVLVNSDLMFKFQEVYFVFDQAAFTDYVDGPRVPINVLTSTLVGETFVENKKKTIALGVSLNRLDQERKEEIKNLNANASQQIAERDSKINDLTEKNSTQSLNIQRLEQTKAELEALSKQNQNTIELQENKFASLNKNYRLILNKLAEVQIAAAEKQDIFAVQEAFTKLEAFVVDGKFNEKDLLNKLEQEHRSFEQSKKELEQAKYKLEQNISRFTAQNNFIQVLSDKNIIRSKTDPKLNDIENYIEEQSKGSAGIVDLILSFIIGVLITALAFLAYWFFFMDQGSSPKTTTSSTEQVSQVQEIKNLETPAVQKHTLDKNTVDEFKRNYADFEQNKEKLLAFSFPGDKEYNLTDFKARVNAVYNQLTKIKNSISSVAEDGLSMTPTSELVDDNQLLEIYSALHTLNDGSLFDRTKYMDPQGASSKTINQVKDQLESLERLLNTALSN
ncbi:hypothetical protein CKF54_04115 [Psittacicella hinzii]|uniref:Uncharacterized protein n=1 Tax=Psittacicella hinzii TaxID=2028575 RepID=A0A3A1Y5K1_9GAMM|nr:hypothetical protein [Psittacicella hinzii]RIY32885.1 hypothetical protein CKF54_04115 [Psittacicella hinzii]